MRIVKLFEEFANEGIVKTVTPNKGRARSLVAESERKMRSLQEHLAKIGVKEDNANDYVEYCYDIVMYLLRAKLYLEGYSASGTGAHEAEVAYMRTLGFDEKDVQFADQMRYFRNGILYYGTVLDKEYAEKCIEFANSMFKKLKSILGE